MSETNLSSLNLTDGGLSVAGTVVINSSGQVVETAAIEISNGDTFPDNNGGTALGWGVVSSAVNYLTINNAATGAGPSIVATGSDTNIAVVLAAKGNGAVNLGQSGSVGVMLLGDQPICDSSLQELIKFTKTASAVNEVNVSNAATGGAPVLSATGSDTNIDLRVAPKGNGAVEIPTTESGAHGAHLNLYQDSASPAANDQVGELHFYGEDSGSNKTEYARVAGTIVDPTDTSEAAAVDLYAMVAGSLSQLMRVSSAGIRSYDPASVKLLDLSGNEVLVGTVTASAVNYATVVPSATGNAVRVGCAGDDTDIDLMLSPRGTGVVQYGTHSALGAETVTGYITIKDGGGTVRKLAVVS